MDLPKGSHEQNPRILRSLQYFEAVARHGSVKGAAEEFRVSASAISHQLRSLSGYIGEDLFVRSGRGLVLSERGQRLQVQVASVFSDLSAALRDSVGEYKPRLRVAVCSSFGPHWLAPRLPAFLARHPNIDIELRLYARDPEQTESVSDAIITAEPAAEGFDAVKLFDEKLVAVGLPTHATTGRSVPRRLITTDVPPAVVGQDWLDFCAETGSTHAGSGLQFVRCTHYVLALSLAKAGVGDALVPDFVASEALAAGTVVAIDKARVSSGRTYKLCYKAARSGDPDLRALAKWLKSICDQLK